LSVVAAVVAPIAACPIASADDDALPPCPQTSAVINPETTLDHVDCHMQSTDPIGLGFDVTYWPTGDPEPKAAKVVVTDRSGEVTQTINELLEPSSPAGVGLQDLDGDGRDEVIIPMNRALMNGAANTRFSVWRPVGDSKHFERTQMVGQAVYPSPDGYVVTNGGALTSRDLTFYKPTAAGYTLIVSLTIGAEQVEPGSGRVLKVSCRAHQQQGLQMVGMDVYQAEDTFCASPAANAIWPDAERISIRPWPRPR